MDEAEHSLVVQAHEDGRASLHPVISSLLSRLQINGNDEGRSTRGARTVRVVVAGGCVDSCGEGRNKHWGNTMCELFSYWILTSCQPHRVTSWWLLKVEIWPSSQRAQLNIASYKQTNKNQTLWALFLYQFQCPMKNNRSTITTLASHIWSLI